MAWGCVQGGGKDGCEIGQSLAAVLSPPSDKSEATIRASRKKSGNYYKDGIQGRFESDPLFPQAISSSAVLKFKRPGGFRLPTDCFSRPMRFHR